MNATEVLHSLAGTWQGVNRLRMMPDDAYVESPATASIRVVAREYVAVEYTWSDAGIPQDGIVLIAASADPITAVWADSWHSSPAWMSMSGAVEDDTVVLSGSYADPPGPDWGWQIRLDSRSRRLTMHNQVPGEAFYQVVELTLESSQ